MKIAILIQCHKNPEQVNLLIDVMQHPAFTFFIHVDKKSGIQKELKRVENVFVLPDEWRVDVQWAGLSQVDATLNLLNYARQKECFDAYWLCSGQDFPVKSAQEIVDWFEAHAGYDFVELFESKNNGSPHENHYDKRTSVCFPGWMLGNTMFRRVCKRAYVELTGGYNKTFRWARRAPVNGWKFYFGSQWVCLSSRTTEQIIAYLKEHPEYYRFFENSFCADEAFFQTLVMNLPGETKRMDYLHYVDWSEGKNSPKTLLMEDYDRLIRTDKLMARKFDAKVDAEIMESLRKSVSEKM